MQRSSILSQSVSQSVEDDDDDANQHPPLSPALSFALPSQVGKWRWCGGQGREQHRRGDKWEEEEEEMSIFTISSAPAAATTTTAPIFIRAQKSAWTKVSAPRTHRVSELIGFWWPQRAALLKKRCLCCCSIVGGPLSRPLSFLLSTFRILHPVLWQTAMHSERCTK